MTRIAETTLEAIRQRVDIAELVREYVPELKRSGRSHKARCPFHQERTPSFMVNPERQIFHCFGCQEGGDAFAFLMKMEGLSFSEAVRKLAERAGVQVAAREDALSPRERELLRARECLAFAQEFYRKELSESPQAEGARRYLASRGLDAATRERFALGFAPASGSALLEAALRKGFSPDLLSKSGLVTLLEGSGRYRDFFRGRVLFPIRDSRGETAGFGARALGEEEPKYLNSRDTPAFSKGRLLYGLFEGLAELRKARKAILLEGYMDVLAAHQFGARNACAPLGTAVTQEHVEALRRRGVEEVAIVFDPDAAGAAASLRGAELLLERGFAVRVATVPGGLDPDELLHQEGPAAFERCLEDAQDLPGFQTRTALSGRAGPLSPEEKSRVANAVLATIAKAQDEILKREWARRLAQRLEVDEESLFAQMRRKGAPAPARSRPVGPAEGTRARPLPAAEEAMLRALLKKPELAAQGRVEEGDFEHDGARRIFQLLRERAKGGGWNAASLLGELGPEQAPLARRLLLEEGREEDPVASLDRSVEQVRLLRRYRELDALVYKNKAGAADPALAREYHALLKRLSDLRLLDRSK